jgi:aminocarboxymuconate-semialdehyde decarboxylase
MLFTCGPNCDNPSHAHGRRALALATSTNSRLSVDPKPKQKKAGKSADKVVDIHCHYFNPAVGAKAAVIDPGLKEFPHIFANDITREVNFKQMRDRAPQLSNLPTRIKKMDQMGVDIQVVSPAPFQYYYFAEPDFGRELARDVNDGIASLVAQQPDRLMGMGTVPLQNSDFAVKELERAVKQLGLKGIEIGTNVNGKDLTDPSLGLEKFFAKAQELGVVLFMHPNGFSHAPRLTDHYLNNIIGNPLETTVAVSHLIFDGVMKRYPRLKIILAHGGGYIAHYWARMDHGHKRPDVRTVITTKPSKYLEKFYFDTITFDPDMLRHLVDRFGADHVMLGTDFPYDMGETDPVGLISSVPKLSKADAKLIMGGNAQRLFKIKS